jgi:antagonist of KipI
MFSILRPGLLTTVQDAGRWGHQHEGVPVAGPMDPWSHRRAARLVGNPEAAASLEITLAGPRIVFQQRAVFALSGASFSMTLRDASLVNDRAYEAAAGDVLDIGRPTAGARGYLALAGGIDAPVVLGSRATHLPSRMGGLDGRALVAGDRLALGRAESRAPGSRASQVPVPSGGARVRVLPGPDLVDPDEAFQALLRGRYRVTPASNRMGYRLEGPELPMEPAERLSSVTPLGTIQVPPGGQPILLMADRQTTGGYRRLATVVSADIGLAGQLAPGDWIEFESCTMGEALSALRARLAETL